MSKQNLSRSESVPGTRAPEQRADGHASAPACPGRPGAAVTGIRPATASTAARDNVDPRERARYAALAGTWWDTSGPFWPLHRLNALRARYLRDAVARAYGRDPLQTAPLSGLRILDVGCGGGILSESMARLGAQVLGIDVVERNIAVATLHARESGLDVRYEAATTGDLLARGVRFDVVLNMEVVEHVPDVPTFLTECANLVREGGLMAVATINRTALSWLFAIVGAEYVLRWLPRGTHRWSRFVPPDQVQAQLAAHGFEVEHRTGVRVNPFNRRFSLTPTMQVNYMLLARRGLPAAGTSEPGGPRRQDMEAA